MSDVKGREFDGEAEMLVSLNEVFCVPTTVWRRIRLGAHNDANSYREALKLKGINISKWADETLRIIDVASVQQEISLVKLSSGQLGFTSSVPREAIYERAFSVGLGRCVPEIGPRLREEYLDQPDGEWLLIGMAPLPRPHSHPELFVLERDDYDVLWLNSFWAISGHLWSPKSQWVFTLPR
jgi:hypothetical protein